MKYFSNLFAFLRAVSPLLFLIGGPLVIALCYGWLLEDFIVSDMLYVYAAIPTLFTMIGLGVILYSSGRRRIERKAVRNALENRPPKDGEMYAFLGVLEAECEILTSPFTGQDCILYEYTLTETVHHHGRREEGGITEETRYSGFHLCPCHVNTMQGPIALHVYPQSSVSVSGVALVETKQSARNFVEQTRFMDAHGLNYMTKSGEIAAQLMNDVGRAVSMDVCFTAGSDLDKLNINEEYVPPGTEVCLYARYDATRKAAVAGRYGAEMSSLDRDLLEIRARGSWVRSLAWGLVFAAIGLGFGILPLGPSEVLENLGSPGKSMLELRESHLWSAIREDTLPLPWQVVNFFEPDARDTEGRTLLMSTNDPGVVSQLLKRGANPNAVDNRGRTALLNAVARCEGGREEQAVEIARILVDKGGDPGIRDADGLTALELARRQCGSEMVSLLSEAPGQL
jgi:hypothetical protein